MCLYRGCHIVYDSECDFSDFWCDISKMETFERVGVVQDGVSASHINPNVQ